jgi:predicted amidohydrolase
MARVLRIAAAQMRSGLDAAANIAAVAEVVREAANAGARFVATPENTTRLDRDRDRLGRAMAAADLAAETKALCRIANEHGVWLLVGSIAAPADAPRVFNRSLLIDPAGVVRARYDKIHLFEAELGEEKYKESDGVAPGGAATLATGPLDAKIGLTICYDLRFPHLYRRLAQAGAEIITLPSAFTVPTGRAHWEILVRARAIETGAFILAPAQGGRHEDGRATWGHTMIVGPWGDVVKALPGADPGLIIADIDLDHVAEARARIPAWRSEPEFLGP